MGASGRARTDTGARPSGAWRWRHDGMLVGATVAVTVLSAAVVAIVLPAFASGAGPLVQVVTDATEGPVLATSDGLPLYTLRTDHGGVSTCTGPCLVAWPPLTVPSGATPTAGPGVPDGSLGTSVQSDGRNQVTFDGSPLYTFVSDSPDTVTGQGVAGFYVVQIKAAPATTTTPPSTPVTTAAPAPPTTLPAGHPSTTVVPTTSPPRGSVSGPSTSIAGAGANPGSDGSPGAGAVPGVSGSPAPATAAAGNGAAVPTGTTPGALAFTGSGDMLRLTFLAGATMGGAGAIGLVFARRRRPALRGSLRS